MWCWSAIKRDLAIADRKVEQKFGETVAPENEII